MIQSVRVRAVKPLAGRSRARGVVRRSVALLILGSAGYLISGCAPTPRVLTPDEQHVIDRSEVEYPGGFELRRYVTNLTAPTAIAIEPDGSLLVAEGERDEEPAIVRIYRSGKQELFYPRGRKIPFSLVFTGWKMYGPIGGMVAYQGEVYVSHRDENGMGVITALDNRGNHRTVVANLPAQGDYGVTDIAIDSGLLYFGVGTATNSGVVGLDNWTAGWVVRHPEVHDIPLHDQVLYGYRFNSPNPMAGLFGPADLAVTGPFQAFSQAFQLRVPAARDGKPNGAICSVPPQGGPMRVEGFGIHNPRGIAFDAYHQGYFTNRGMEPRGTRPILHDNDAMLKLLAGQPWYGWPDYSATLRPISDDTYQPPADMIAGTGYPQVAPLVNERGSNLTSPVREALLAAEFPWMAGAEKLQFLPADGPFSHLRGSAIVALSGDRLPFATGGRPLIGPGDYKVADGFKLVIVDLDTHTVRDFIRNTRDLPASKLSGSNADLIERPYDIKFGPDAAYILDFGRLRVKDGKEHVDKGSGQIFRLVPTRQNRVAPSSTQAADTQS